jgi:Spy/CpxP family protein refolding chaperone
MKSATFNRKHLLLSMAIVVCTFLAAGVSYAQSDTGNSDRPQRQRQFQGENRGPGQGQGQGKGEGRGQGMRGPFSEVIEALNLTDDQKAKVKEVLTKHHDQMEAFREKHGDQMQQFREDLRKAMESKDYDAMHKLVDTFKSIDQDRPTLKSLADDLRGILNADQQAIFDKKIEEIKAKGPGKHMRRGGDGERGPGNDGLHLRRRDNQQPDNAE